MTTATGADNDDITNITGAFQLSVDEPSGAEYGDSPLLDFWAVGAGYEVKGGTSAKGRAWQRVYFKGVDVEVLEATDVYPYPTSEVSIFYSDPTKTPKRKPGEGTNDWEALCESLRLLYGPEKAAEAINDLWGGPVVGEGTAPTKPGRRHRMKRVPTRMRVGPNAEKAAELLAAGDQAGATTFGKWHDEVVLGWRVVEVDGIGKLEWNDEGDLGKAGTIAGSSNGAGSSAPGGISTAQYVLNLADGKTEPEFNAAATDDDVVMADPGLITQLSDHTWLNNMLQVGILTKDANGVLHKQN